ncbi:hypothetical protein NQ318_012654 [Aromia moschata]|uniref:methylated diphthine methylhydrolase n=1 Tax=Aromia moschata TaxID=1265417 RepID=A0AAV8X8K2_9CUCU|nr:hypothetical protein NQ318_012654 [Aromia moschata]
MSESQNISILHSFDTEYGADAVEWCPHSPHESIFVCGNYELKETGGCQPKKRFGRVLLFSVMPEISVKCDLKLHQIINLAAVLDLKWCPNKINGDILLGVVTASDRIEIYKLTEDIQLELISFYEVQRNDENLILSLDWSTSLHSSDEPEIICSDSSGYVHLLKLINKSLILQNSYHGHKFEAWIAGFYYWDTNTFFSELGISQLQKNRVHTAGVTSLHSNCSREHIVATGSYDENIRLWDIRNIKSELKSVTMPGPLWRLKWDPFCQNYLLAACMLGGVHIVDLRNMDETEIIGSLYEHKSICYGADWSHMKNVYSEKKILM